MFGRFSTSMGLVGVDFGTHSIKMLQVREVAGPMGAPEVVGAARIDVPLVHLPSNAKPSAGAVSTSSANPALPANAAGEPNAMSMSPVDGADLSEQIRAAFVAGGFTGRRCVVGLAREDVHVQSIRLPKMPDDELRQTATWEAAQRFGFERNAMQVDFIRTGAVMNSGENREEIILIAAPHAAIHARLEPVLAAGLRPIAVDTAFTALVRTFSRQVRREADLNIVRAVVEIGASGSTILILRGDQIAFCKPLSISGNLFNRAVADHLQMKESDASELRQARIAAARQPRVASSECPAPGAATNGSFADEIGVAAQSSFADPATDRAVYAAVRPIMGELVKEITLCMRYYGVTFRGHPPERIILTGGDALEPKLDEMISKACKVPVVFDDAAHSLGDIIGQIQSTLYRTPGPAACWAAAIGLSIRSLCINRTSKNEKRSRPTVMKGAA